MSETWLHKKGWERIKRKLLKGFVWETQEVGKRNKKGRTMVDMIVGTKKEIERKEDLRVGKDEGLLTVKVS